MVRTRGSPFVHAIFVWAPLADLVVLEIDPLSVGHRLGVNGLAYDSDNSIL